jgi:hypothetical protein
MKRFLGFACAIAIACVAIGCGGDKATKPEDKKPGTSQTGDKAPNMNADSEGQTKAPMTVPEQPPEPKANTPEKAETPVTPEKSETPVTPEKAETPSKEAPAPAKPEKAKTPETDAPAKSE